MVDHRFEAGSLPFSEHITSFNEFINVDHAAKARFEWQSMGVSGICLRLGHEQPLAAGRGGEGDCGGIIMASFHEKCLSTFESIFSGLGR